MKTKLVSAWVGAVLLIAPHVQFGQAPDMGIMSEFALFTTVGAFDNVGTTDVVGDVGTNTGAVTGFPLGTVTGQIHVEDTVSAQAALDVDTAYLFLSGLACGGILAPTLGNTQVLTPNVYCVSAASSITGDLTLDAEGNPNALFIFQIGGALSAAAVSHVILINSASACNVYWQVNGAFSLGEDAIFSGTLIADGAITFLDGAFLEGRALTRQGAIALTDNTISVECSPSLLPVTLVSFDAQADTAKAAVNVRWKTVSEVNSDYFLIERSAEGLNFASIGMSKAAGSSHELRAYSFTDENPVQGTNYYRLSQFDLEGSHMYSQVVQVQFSQQDVALRIYPNPFTHSIMVSVPDISHIRGCELRIYDRRGGMVFHSVITQETTSFETEALPFGIYFYTVIADGKTIQSGKLVSHQ